MEQSADGYTCWGYTRTSLLVLCSVIRSDGGSSQPHARVKATLHPNSSSVQEQAKAHTGHGPSSDDHEEFETSPHRTLAGIAGFNCPEHQGCKRRKSICPPFGLWHGEQHWERWDEATDHKRDPDLHALQPRVDMCVFDHPQLIMYHGAVPAFPVGREMADDTLQEWATKALVLVDGTQFCPFLFRLMLNLIAFRCDALLKYLLRGPCRKIAPKRHRNPSCQHLTQYDQE